MFRINRKNLNRIAVFALILAPAIYLFGTRFFALAGAHGERVLAEEGTSFAYETYTPSAYTDFVADDVYKFVWDIPTNEWLVTSYPVMSFFIFDIDSGNKPIAFQFDPSNGRGLFYYYSWDSGDYFRVYLWETSSWLDGDSYKSIYFYGSYVRNSAFTFMQGKGTFYHRIEVPNSTPLDYSQTLFGEFFPADNFLSKIGEEAIGESPRGFAPFGYLLSYLDENMFHMSGDSLGLTAYGYFYWCAHVLLFDLIFWCAVFFIDFAKALVYKFEENID